MKASADSSSLCTSAASGGSAMVGSFSMSPISDGSEEAVDEEEATPSSSSSSYSKTTDAPPPKSPEHACSNELRYRVTFSASSAGNACGAIYVESSRSFTVGQQKMTKSRAFGYETTLGCTGAVRPRTRPGRWRL